MKPAARRCMLCGGRALETEALELIQANLTDDGVLAVCMYGAVYEICNKPGTGKEPASVEYIMNAAHEVIGRLRELN